MLGYNIISNSSGADINVSQLKIVFLMKRIESFTRWLASVCSQPDQSVLSLVSCLPAPMVMALGERKGGLSRNPLA